MSNTIITNADWEKFIGLMNIIRQTGIEKHMHTYSSNCQEEEEKTYVSLELRGKIPTKEAKMLEQMLNERK